MASAGGKVKVELVSKRQGTVLVRAKPPGGRLNDAKPVCGFDGFARRYVGETFLIEKWQDFSPRWMEFVASPAKDAPVIDPPEGWAEHINLREQQLGQQIAQAKRENAQSVKEQQFAAMFSMFQVQANQAGLGGQFDTVTGKVVARTDAATAALADENEKLKAEVEALKAAKSEPETKKKP